METDNQAITKENKQPNLFRAITPIRAKKLALELVDFVKENNLSVKIAGHDYLYVEAWQFIGMQLALTEVVQSCEQVMPMDLEKPEVKYKATVELINQHGTVLSRGFAWCSNKETKKKSFDEYAVASMAQTRAIGKAYRNKFSWIVKMAGYEATPADEMDRENMEAELKNAKQEVLKAINASGITKGHEVIEKIQEVLGKRVIETIDDANKIIKALNETE